MRLSMFSTYEQGQKPIVRSSSRVANVGQYFRQKQEAVFAVGPTVTGKSRFAIDLATRFLAEIINSDKIQVHKGLDIATNKVSEEECRAVPHHLLGTADSNANFSTDDFRHLAPRVVQSLVLRDRLPVIAGGGSNSCIEALANNDPEFRLRYECCFLWVDVSLPVLHSFVSERVDRMLRPRLEVEVRNVFDYGNRDYSQDIRRATGVPELDEYFRNEAFMDAKNRGKVPDKAIAKIKDNTCTLAGRQLQKIRSLHNRSIWNLRRIDAHISNRNLKMNDRARISLLKMAYIIIIIIAMLMLISSIPRAIARPFHGSPPSVFVSMFKGPVTPSGPSNCTNIPGYKGGHC